MEQPGSGSITSPQVSRELNRHVTVKVVAGVESLRGGKSNGDKLVGGWKARNEVVWRC